MFRPKELPNITKDVVITENIFVVAKILHLKNDEHEFTFNNGTWFIKVADGNFINLGVGGRPNFHLEEAIEHENFNDFFESEEQTENEV